MELKEKLYLKFSRNVQMAEIIPKGWGVAYFNYNSDTGVVMPIPLNLIVGGLRWMYYRLVQGIYPTAIDKWIEHGRVLERSVQVNIAADTLNETLPRILYERVMQANSDGVFEGIKRGSELLKKISELEQEIEYLKNRN